MNRNLSIMTIILFVASCAPFEEFDVEKYNQLIDGVTTSIFKVIPLFEAKKFEDARKELLNAKLNLAEAESVVETQKPADIEILRTDIAAQKKIIRAIELFIDAEEFFSKYEDVRVLDIYNKYIDKLINARNEYVDGYNLLLEIQNKLTNNQEHLEKYQKTIEELDAKLEAAQDPEFIKIVIINTYVSKINPSSVRDLAIQLIRERCIQEFGTPCEDDVERATVLYHFVRDNHEWIGDPSSFEVFQADYIQSPQVTLKQRAGDCDDQAVLLNSLLESIGIPSGFCFGNTEGQKLLSLADADHAFSSIIIDGEFIIADPTCKKSELGETCFPKLMDANWCIPIAEFKQLLKAST